MCIFAGPAEVSATRIAALLSTDGREQFTAYEMEFAKPPALQREHILFELDGPHGNAMILPVPWSPGDSPVRMVDLSRAEDLFDKLDSLVDIPRTRGGTKGFLSFGMGTDSFLEVLEVGSFSVSIAYSLADIARANPDVFTLSPEAAATLEANYASGFAFVICALRESGKIHPLGYISTFRDTLFVPTRHEHGSDEDLPEWDHTIYVSRDDLKRRRGSVAQALDVSNGQMSFYAGQEIREPSSTGWDYVGRTWDGLIEKVPELAAFRKAHPVAKYVMDGKFANTDFRPSV